MRTLKLTYNLRINSDSNISVATEEIVDIDDEARVRGNETMKIIMYFIAGMGETMEEKSEE